MTKRCCLMIGVATIVFAGAPLFNFGEADEKDPGIAVVRRTVVGNGKSPQGAEIDAAQIARNVSGGSYVKISSKTTGVGMSWDCTLVIEYKPAPTDDLTAMFQGTWELAGQAPDGESNSAKWTLEVKGSTFTFRSDEKVTRKVTATLHPMKLPAAIDLKEDGEEKPFLAIYKLEKGRLTLCIAVESARPTDTRPTTFEAKPGQTLATYNKSKAR